MSAQDSPAFRHLDVIQNEIQRLDRVVQTLVDFSRPVELKLHDQDLRRIVNSVLMLASVELETRDVRVLNELPARPVIAKVDADLMQQALLNVVLNGAQAMMMGGTLRVRLTEDSRWAAQGRAPDSAERRRCRQSHPVAGNVDKSLHGCASAGIASQSGADQQ